MLEAKTMTKIESILGMEGGALKVAIESDDSKELTIPTGDFVNTETHQVFSNEQLQTREDSLKKTHEKAGAEMLIKDFKRENSLEFDGKTVEHLRAFDKERILKEAGKEPDARIKELELKNEKLVSSNGDWETKHDGLVASNAQAETKRNTDNDILGFMDGKYSIPKADILTIFNSKHNVSGAGNDRIVSRGGEKLEDGKTFAPLGLNTVVSDFAKQYATTPEGGGGGGDEGGGGKGSNMEAFNKRQKDKGNNRGSEAYMREMADEQKAGTLTA